LANLPQRPIAGLLRLILLPLGARAHRPDDALDHQLARLLQTPSPTRDRLGRGQYLAPTEGNPAGQLEEALRDILLAEPLFRKICQHFNTAYPFTGLDKLAARALEAGVIHEEEAQLLIRAEHGRLRSINVDDFDPRVLPAGQQASSEAPTS
ncbi:MAG: acyl-CoA dehydrogenase domain-containing protein, partial [Plesiomonas shigelloides]